MKDNIKNSKISLIVNPQTKERKFEKKIEDYIIYDSNYEDITISDDEGTLIEASKNFLNILENEYGKHVKKYNEIYGKWGKKCTSKNGSYICREFLYKKSPLTIINGLWGSGKTYFIENFIEYLDKLENENNRKSKLKNTTVATKNNGNQFRKAIYIDVWRYSTSKNLPDELMEQIFNVFKTKFDLGKDYINKIGGMILSIASQKALGINIKNETSSTSRIKKSRNNASNSVIKKGVNEFPKTIIFFDNIERLGKDSWEVIKAIVKITEIENFIVILPMNLNALTGNGNDVNSRVVEYPIEKYVDITMFHLKQDYKSLLSNLGFNKENINNINNILSSSINGVILSIRDVKKRLEAHPKILKEENVHQVIKLVAKNIWSSYTSVYEYYYNIFSDVLNFVRRLNDVWLSVIDMTKDYIRTLGETTDRIKALMNNGSIRREYSDFFESIIYDDFEVLMEKSDEYLLENNPNFGHFIFRFNLNKLKLVMLKKEIENDISIIENTGLYFNKIFDIEINLSPAFRNIKKSVAGSFKITLNEAKSCLNNINSLRKKYNKTLEEIRNKYDKEIINFIENIYNDDINREYIKNDTNSGGALKSNYYLDKNLYKYFGEDLAIGLSKLNSGSFKWEKIIEILSEDFMNYKGIL